MKERFLTILVPITDTDVTSVFSSYNGMLNSIRPSIDRVNEIYKVGNDVYYRIQLNKETNQYEFVKVIDREFPYLGKPLEIFDFTYDAERMGTAPTISAQGVMWYAEKDDNGFDVTLEGMWSQVCHVSFNGENFYLKQIPTSSKSNEDARYKYDIDFVSERVVLERVYMYDVVRPFITEKAITESTTFSFYGGIEDFVKRINASLIESGLASVALLDGVTRDAFLTFEEFNAVGVGTYQGTKDTSDPYPNTQARPLNVYERFEGNYTLYLYNRAYLIDDAKTYHIDGTGTSRGYDIIYDGTPRIHGYICKIGTNDKGENVTSEEKLVSIDKNTIHEALQQVYDTFELQYYIYRDGEDTIIMIGDCQHDFADVNTDGSIIRDNDNLPISENPFDYGVSDALLSKEKSNTTDKIVTRITGVGSESNIPWYYPNPTPDGWIRPLYRRDDATFDGVSIDYPLEIGTTSESSRRYEKYLKNRVGVDFEYGKIWDMKFYGSDVLDNIVLDEQESKYVILTNETTVDSAFSVDLYEVGSEELGLTVESIVVNVFDENSVSGSNPNGWKIVGTWDSSQKLQQMVFEEGRYQFNVKLSSEEPLSLRTNRYWLLPGDAKRDNYTMSLLVPRDALSEKEILSIKHFDYVKSDTLWYYTSDETGKAKYLCDAENLISNPFGVIVIGNRWETFASKTYSNVRIVTDKNRADGGWDGYYYTIKTTNAYGAFSINPGQATLEFSKTAIYKAITGRIRFWKLGWYLNGKDADFNDYGIELSYSDGVSPKLFDKVCFQRIKYITPQSKLMPEVYIKTDGENRFYNAHNYTNDGAILPGTADSTLGEIDVNGNVRNPLYKENETDEDSKHYVFENEYFATVPHEHIEDFEDIKPTIKEQKNYVKVSVSAADFAQNASSYFTLRQDGVYVQCLKTDTYSSTKQYYALVRIDVVEEFAYDTLDNDEIWASDEEDSGEYKHPYFFAKLRPLGFNLFDCALQEDMQLSLTTGHCGACTFKIGVDDNTKKNPVQIWEHDVYRGVFSNRKLVHEAGSLRRYEDTANLYYDTDGTEDGYISVNSSSIYNITKSEFGSSSTYMRQVLSSEDVVNGLVGSLKNNNKVHFDGDVKVSGRFIDAQQDTTDNYVWIALYKDTDTYGTIMPSAQPDTVYNTYSKYIEPKGHIYTNRKTGDVSTVEDDDADKFVLLNIKLPQVYLRRAERDLSRALIAYMYDNNYQKFNFSIAFSRIFLAQNATIDADLNENSVLYVRFNNKTYRQYVKSYSYKMERDAVLPEITVELNDELSVSKTKVQQQAAIQEKALAKRTAIISRTLSTTETRISRNTISRNDDVLIKGNIISSDNSTSINDVFNSTRNVITGNVENAVDVSLNKADLTNVHGNFTRLVGKLNTFNQGVDDRLKQIRKTIETRVMPKISGSQQSSHCSGMTVWTSSDGTENLFWLSESGTEQAAYILKDKDTYVCVESSYYGMTDVSWTDFTEDK